MTDNRKPSSALTDAAYAIRRRSERKVLSELEQWLYDLADGAPDAPAWRKEAGFFADRLRELIRSPGPISPQKETEPK